LAHHSTIRLANINVKISPDLFDYIRHSLRLAEEIKTVREQLSSNDLHIVWWQMNSAVGNPYYAQFEQGGAPGHFY